VRNWIIVGIVIISLLGLVFVQYNYLRAGVLLERNQLDQRISYLLDEVYLKLVGKNDVREMTLRMLVSERSPLASPELMLPYRLQDSLHQLIREYLGNDSLRMDYAFALTDEKQDHLFMATEDYQVNGEKQLSYEMPIGGIAVRACNCTPYFRLNVKNTLNYLLGRLAYLIIPTVIFILLLAGCLGLLIYYLNHQRKLDSIKNDFINNLTHELKTPVFSIGMLSRMLKTAVGKGQTEKAEEYATLIEKENEVIKGHVERVLELASLEGRNFQMEKQRLSLHSLIGEIINAFGPQVLARNGKLTVQLEATADWIEVDPVHFRNVIQNLLDNALKYQVGEPFIEIRTRNEEQWLVVSVTDNGIGIAPDQQDRIFEKFYRVPSGDLHPVKGFGLGLNYVRQIVKAHHGQIKVFSKSGEGSRFEVALPLTGGDD
jgi:two-component system phosphate regulon sensor histidine kinase PhoR